MTGARSGQVTRVTATLPERRPVGWVFAAVAVLVLLVAVASPVIAPAGSAGTLVIAVFVLALSLGGIALTYLLPARR